MNQPIMLEVEMLKSGHEIQKLQAQLMDSKDKFNDVIIEGDIARLEKKVSKLAQAFITCLLVGMPDKDDSLLGVIFDTINRKTNLEALNFVELGLKHERYGDFKLALNAYDQALEICHEHRSSHSAFYLYRAELCLRLGLFTPALDDLQEAEKLYLAEEEKDKDGEGKAQVIRVLYDEFQCYLMLGQHDHAAKLLARLAKHPVYGPASSRQWEAISKFVNPQPQEETIEAR